MQNDMRDRLIELYKEATTLYFDYLDSIDEKGLTDTEGRAKFTIDHLIANGVVLPPCKVGDKVYTISIDREIEEYTVLGVVEYPNGWFVGVHYGGCSYTIPVDKVFFTKEQAEQKLKELRENG